MTTFQKSKRALKRLAKWYTNVTLITLKKNWKGNSANTLYSLIGFGKNDCMVCKSVNYDCYGCIWYKLINTGNLNCSFCIYTKTYKNIENADTPRELKTACRARAKYLDKLLKEYDKNNKK